MTRHLLGLDTASTGLISDRRQIATRLSELSALSEVLAKNAALGKCIASQVNSGENTPAKRLTSSDWSKTSGVIPAPCKGYSDADADIGALMSRAGNGELGPRYLGGDLGWPPIKTRAALQTESKRAERHTGALRSYCVTTTGSEVRPVYISGSYAMPNTLILKGMEDGE